VKHSKVLIELRNRHVRRGGEDDVVDRLLVGEHRGTQFDDQ
jgi:hypothetical protein